MRAWIALLDAHQESQRRCAAEERDPLAVPLSTEQRRADALIAMIQDHQVGKQAPSSGGDRPRVVVTLDYHKLMRQAAGLISDNEPVSAGELRQLCCDAGLLPAVLGGPSRVYVEGTGYPMRVLPGAVSERLDLPTSPVAEEALNSIFPCVMCSIHRELPFERSGLI